MATSKLTWLTNSFIFASRLSGFVAGAYLLMTFPLKSTRNAVDFIASITSHIPNRNEQTVRYLGYYSNVCRGKRRKQEVDQPDYAIEDDLYNKSCSKSWARLIKKIYEVDPLTCTNCGGSMRIIAFIEDYKVIKKILDWLGIYEFKRDRPPPKRLSVTDLFDDFSQDNYINADYSDF